MTVANAEVEPAPDAVGERELLRRALGREPAAVRALVRYLEPRLLLRAHSLLSYRGGRGPRAEAMDLVQAAWRELIRDEWKVLRQWDPERGVRLISYVGVVATNRMISELRKGRREASEIATPPEDMARIAALVDGLEDRVSDRQYLELVVTELRARLSGKGQTAFEVLYLEGLSVEEAMAKTALTRESIYSHRRRIKKLVQSIAEQISRRRFTPTFGATAPDSSHR